MLEVELVPNDVSSSLKEEGVLSQKKQGGSHFEC